MARDQRDQRTKLNAELAHDYSSARKRATATPGRSSLTGEEQQLDGVENELEEQEPEVAEQEQEVVEREPKKSLFELPRKEPSRQPLLGSPFSPQPAMVPPAATPSAPTQATDSSKPKSDK